MDRLSSAVGWVRDHLPEELSSRLRGAKYRYSVKDIPQAPPLLEGHTRVFIGPANFAAQGFTIARAIEKLPGTSAFNMHRGRPSGFNFSADLSVPVTIAMKSQRWNRSLFEAVASRFTHVLIETGRPLFGPLFGGDVREEVAQLRKRGVTVGVLSYGSELRLPSRHAASSEWSPFLEQGWDAIAGLESTARRFAALLGDIDAPVFVTTPDMLLDWPPARWIPIVIDVDRYAADSAPLERERPVVVHAPTNAVIKGSALIEPMLYALQEEGLIDYQRIQRIQSSEMPDLYRSADIVLEQFRLGTYATAAIESLAAGRVVVAHVDEQVRGHIRDEYGLEVPIVNATPDTLESVIRDIVARREDYRALAADGPDFVRTLHDGAASREVLRDFLGA